MVKSNGVEVGGVIVITVPLGILYSNENSKNKSALASEALGGIVWKV